MSEKDLTSLLFDNSYTSLLPADTQTQNFSRHVKNCCYSFATPSKPPKPHLIAYAQEVAQVLELSTETCESSDFLEVFSGNRLLSGMHPYASCYGGHQFGHWAGQLGDGRAINLGEILNTKGERWTLQLKGAGPTPYSRKADGFAVLRSSVREFLCSEAMYHLGIPTTRALSLISTGQPVIRDMFYDGHPKAEPGAIVCRVAPSFTRFGHFQILTARDEIDLLKRHVDYTITTDFPHLGPPSKSVYLKWFEEICTKTAEMIVHWMRVGFVHGVMNTDNMSVLGLTIDYGPYGWLENYDPHWTPNTTDNENRRYCFGNQPHIALWNLNQLANALSPLFKTHEPLQETLTHYASHFKHSWQQMMVNKLGLLTFNPKTDSTLLSELLTLLQSAEIDMTLFFRNLAQLTISDQSPIESINNTHLIEPFKGTFYQTSQLNSKVTKTLEQWLHRYLQRIRQDNQSNNSRRQQMNAVNPKYVLRNYLAQLAIDKAEQNDYTMIKDLLDVLRQPYAEQAGKEHYAEKRPEWARHRAGCSMLSCSS